MRASLAACAALWLVGGPALAEMPTPYADVYYVPAAKLELGVAGAGHVTQRGDGFGAKGQYPVLDSLAVTAEYQAVGYEDGDLDQYRIGAGWVGASGSGLFLEYIAADIDGEKSDGFGVHARLAGRFAYVQLGHILLEDDVDSRNGYEFAVGITVPVMDRFGVFADVRRTGIGHDRSDVELELVDARVGVRIAFGATAEGEPEPASEPEPEPAEEVPEAEAQ